jgi:tRNA (mo5U34)-methyltransferase
MKRPDRADIDALGPWFHNLHLPDGRQTAPHHPYGDFPSFKWAELAPHLPADLSGWSALDIGCNAGFYSFELARRGADVTGIDREDLYLDQARWAAEAFGVGDRVSFEKAQVYDLARDGRRFDLVLFMGVFYHLRYGVLALDTVARLMPKCLVFQSLTMPGPRYGMEAPEDFGFETLGRVADPAWPKMAFVENRFEGDETNWWIPDRGATEALLRSAGFRILASPNRETHVCEPTGAPLPAEEEWLAATGALVAR